MKCPGCKQGELIYVPQDLPYHEEHLICSFCDGTFNDTDEIIKLKKGEEFMIKFIEDWIKKERLSPTPKQLKKTFPDLFEFELEYLIKEAERRASLC